MNDPIVARLRGVSRRFGSTVAVSGLDLSLRRGEVLALLGPNGAGKTTAVRLFLGILRPNEGEVSVLGDAPRTARMRGDVGVVLQVGAVPDTLRVVEQIEQFRMYYPRPRPLSEILHMTGLGGLETRMFGELSGGQKQRVLFALALAGNPRIIFFDEPTVGLDAEIRRELWLRIAELRDGGVSIVLTTHDLREAETLADRIVVLSGGHKVAEGSPDEIAASASDRRIICRTSMPPDQLRRLPHATGVRCDGGLVEIACSHAEATLRVLFAMDPELSELEVRRADLEEAFIGLTESRGAA